MPLDPPALDLDLPLAILLTPLVLLLGSVLRESSGLEDAATKGDDKSAIQRCLTHALSDALDFHRNVCWEGTFRLLQA
jgi:hypothetical protein